MSRQSPRPHEGLPRSHDTFHDLVRISRPRNGLTVSIGMVLLLVAERMVNFARTNQHGIRFKSMPRTPKHNMRLKS